MKKAFSYEAPRAWDDDDSSNGDAMVRAIEFQMKCLAAPYADEHRPDFKERTKEAGQQYADDMYNFIAEKSIEELSSLAGDLERLAESCKKTQEAVVQMVIGKIVFKGDVPTAAEARAMRDGKKTDTKESV